MPKVANRMSLMANRKSKIQKVKIIANQKIKESYFHLVLQAPYIARYAKPGQFAEVKISDSDEPLLRRPFSIHRVSGNKIEILYEVVGQGSQILSQGRIGEYLDVIGPLGNGFSILDTGFSILVAGGMGVAPLVFLAEKLVKSSIQHPASRIEVLIGAKTKQRVLCADEFRKIGCEVKIATDDGSRGFKGKVTGLLKHLLSSIPACPCPSGRRAAGREHRASSIYACGPRPMLKATSDICRAKNIPGQISLEEHMACGIGACLGCAVGTKDGYKRVCKEGPVFGAQEIIW